jgi:hypothetical protein
MTTSEKNKRAKRNLTLKLALEKTLNRDLVSYFNEIKTDVVSFYTATGLLINADIYQKQTETLLERHYKRVIRNFINEGKYSYRKSLEAKGIEYKQEQEEEDEKIKATSVLIALAFVESIIQRRALQLIETTNDNIKDTAAKATKKAKESGTKVRDEINKGLDKAFKSRYAMIALTETQFMAERSKNIEAAVISRNGDVDPSSINDGVVTGNPDVKKEWAAILDDRTRGGHAMADGQTQNMNDPYIVNGEYLMYPSDTSMGASLGNIINCRCSSLYGV